MFVLPTQYSSHYLMTAVILDLSSSLSKGKPAWTSKAFGPMHVMNAATLNLSSLDASPVTVSYASQVCFHHFQFFSKFPVTSSFGGTGILDVNSGVPCTCAGGAGSETFPPDPLGSPSLLISAIQDGVRREETFDCCRQPTTHCANTPSNSPSSRK